MTDTPDRDWERITAYLTEEHSALPADETREDLAHWITSDPERKATTDAVQRLWDHAAEQPSAERPSRFDANRTTAAVFTRIQQQEPIHRRPATRTPRVLRTAGTAVATAAILVVAVVFGPGWLETVRGQSDLTRTYATARGERTHVNLPDGSHVTLGPESQLIYTSDGAKGPRRLELRGQAYFSVASGSHRPFIVQAGTVTTRVLGTGFTVRAYPDDANAHVAVAEGKVAVNVKDTAVVLTAGDVSAIRNHAVTVSHDAKVVDVLGWTRGHFRMRDVTLREAVAEIERQYDVEVEIRGAMLGDQRVTVAFVGQSAHDLASAIALMIDAQAQWDGQTLVLTQSER